MNPPNLAASPSVVPTPPQDSVARAVGNVPVITSPATATATVGQPFCYQITASNEPSIYGAAGLASGLALNNKTGRVSGTPAEPGSFNVTLSATNPSGTSSKPLILTIKQPAVTPAAKTDTKRAAESLPAAPPKDGSSPSIITPGNQNLKKRRRLSDISSLFILIVFLPTVLAVIYFGLIASDIYVSESHFVVRNPKQQTATAVLGFLQLPGTSNSLSDMYSVQDFMLSKDASMKANEQFGLLQSWGRKEIDRLNRFPGVAFWDKSFEAFSDYYKKRVSVTVDTVTSVATLKVGAFSADQAFRINEMLLKSGEALVNQINDRALGDALRVATREVELAKKKDKDAAKALNDYRIANSLVDPTAQSSIQLTLISNMQADLISTKALLAQSQAFSANNPQIPLLQKRIETLMSEMSTQLDKITGGNNSSLIARQAEYDRLVTDRAFASGQLVAALTSYEQARITTTSQQLYLERISQPSKPDVAVEPRRVRSVVATFLLGMLSWGIVSLLVAGVREHHG